MVLNLSNQMGSNNVNIKPDFTSNKSRSDSGSFSLAQLKKAISNLLDNENLEKIHDEKYSSLKEQLQVLEPSSEDDWSEEHWKL